MLEWCFLQCREELRPTWGIKKIGNLIAVYVISPVLKSLVINPHPTVMISQHILLDTTPVLKSFVSVPKCIRKGTKLPCHSQSSKNNSSEGFFVQSYQAYVCWQGTGQDLAGYPTPPSHTLGAAIWQAFSVFYMLLCLAKHLEPMSRAGLGKV